MKIKKILHILSIVIEYCAIVFAIVMMWLEYYYWMCACVTFAIMSIISHNFVIEGLKENQNKIVDLLGQNTNLLDRQVSNLIGKLSKKTESKN
jgi:hypothetical protein